MPTLIRNAAIGVALLAVLVLLLLALVLPLAAKAYLQAYVQERGGRLTIEHIRFNPLLWQLELEDLRLGQGEREPLLVDALTARLWLPDLLHRHIQIDQLNITGLQVALTRAEDHWRLGDLSVTTPRASGQAETPDWTIQLSSAVVQDSQLQIERAAQVDELGIRRLQLTNLGLRAPGYTGRIELLGTLNQAPFSLDAELTGQDQLLDLYADVILNDYPLDPLVGLLPPDWLGSQGLLDVSSKARLSWTPDGLRLELVDTNVELAQAHLLHPPFQVDTERLQLSSPSTVLVFSQGELDEAKASIRLETATTAIYHQSQQRLLAKWDELTTQSLQFDLDPNLQLRLPEARFSNLTLSHRRDTEAPLPAFFHAKRLSVQGVQFAQRHVAVELVAFRDVDANVVLSSQREPLNLLALELAPARTNPPGTSATSADAEHGTSTSTSTSTSTNDHAGISYSLQRLDITGTNTLTLVDQGVQPEFVRTLIAQSFHLDHLDTRQPQQASPFEFRGSADDYASLQAEGTLHPFAERTNLHLTATLREADLPSLSVYLRNSLNYEFTSGQLDLQASLTVQDDQLEGQAHLTLRGADLSPIAGSAAKTNNNPSLIPLNVALSMLEDSRGNVELDVPLAGDIDSPSFSLNGFIARKLGRAIIRGASTYAVQALVPYAAVIGVVQVAGEQMLQMRFKPLLLKPGDVPGAAQADFIRQFGELMQEREDLQVKLCGVATPADLQLPPETHLSDAQREQLQQLAARRATAFKQEILRHTNVASARLLICNAGIDTNPNAKPRVELKL